MAGQNFYLEQPVDSRIDLGAEREKESVGPEEIQLNDQDQAYLENQARSLDYLKREFD